MPVGLYEWVLKGGRFAIVGVLATIAYAFTTWVSVRWFQVTPIRASFIGLIVSIPVSYVGQKTYTFRSTGRHKIEFPKFCLTSMIAFVGNVGGMAAALQADWDYRVGILIAVIVVPVGSFLAQNFWVFARR